jgi:hypothetical protein
MANYDIIRRRICPTSKSHDPKPGYAVSGYRCRKSISGIHEVVIVVVMWRVAVNEKVGVQLVVRIILWCCACK